MKIKTSITIMLFAIYSFPLSAFAIWYDTTIVEVSIRSHSSEKYYIRTKANPNPANCASTWAGASWYGSGSSYDQALSVALTALAANRPVRIQIDDENCDSGGFPFMNWIQIRE